MLFAAGRSPSKATIRVTIGILQWLTDRELEAFGGGWAGEGQYLAVMMAALLVPRVVYQGKPDLSNGVIWVLRGCC